MQTYTIYKITNTINDKVYIGFTSKTNPMYRWTQHKKCAEGNAIKPSALHLAIRKYGVENFTFEAIYQSLDRDHTLNTMEPYFIGEFGSLTHGYNMTVGGNAGNLGRTMSEDTKARMAAAKRGKKHTSEHTARLAAASAKSYIATTPEGEDIHLTNLSQFCKDRGLTTSSMGSLARGIGKQHKGWKCRTA